MIILCNKIEVVFANDNSIIVTYLKTKKKVKKILYEDIYPLDIICWIFYLLYKKANVT